MQQKKLLNNFEEVLEALNRIADLIISNQDLDFTNLEILKKIRDKVKVFAAIVYEIDSEKKCLYLKSHTRSKLAQMVINFIRNVDIFSVTYPLEADVLISKCVREGKIVTSSILSDFFYPVFNQKAAMDKMQQLMKLENCAAIPIKANNVITGAFFVVSRKKEFTRAELLLLQLFANFYGMAQINFTNIDKLRKNYQAEKEATAILTHELKTPISIAYSSSELLGLTLEKYRNSFKPEFVGKIRQQQLEIQESILRMNMICNSIFSMTEVENHLSLENQKLNLHQDLDKMVQVYKKYSQKGLKFNYYEKICSGTFYGPSVQFQQVVSIILENAFKYTKEGCVEMDLEMDGKQIICQITDTGPGISDDEKKKVFERFFRSSNTDKLKKQRGLGLGLYIAKKITDKLKGTLELVDNPKGQGSRFIIKFPVYKKK